MTTTLHRPATTRIKGGANGGSANGGSANDAAIRPAPVRAARTREPRPFCWTREQYHKMGDWGWFRDTRVELLEGVIYEKYPSRGRAPHPVRWTREQYHRMGRAGWFGERHIELIEAEIYEMSPMNDPHWWSVVLANEALRRAFGAGCLVVAQLPLSLPGAEPQPDVAVFPIMLSERPAGRPDAATLVVEVSDSTLRFDRTKKARTYAAAGIAEYWIVNLKEKQLEVHREPNIERGKYGSVTILAASESVSPLAAPKAKIRVADLLP